MENAEKFWNRIAQDYARSPVKDMTAYNETLTRTRDHLSGEDEVLEIGCGTGTTALVLAESVRHLLATDISGAMIEIARAKAAEQQVKNVRFERAAALDPGLQPGRYDVVLAFNLLHLIRDPVPLLGRVRELLKPNGLFISKTVCLGDSNRLLSLFTHVMRLFGKAPYVRSWKAAELDETITAAGFEIIETGLYPESPPSRFLVARRLPLSR